MLELKEYSRKEIISLFKTDRIDYIKRKLTAQGYSYEGSGRGDTYKIKITELPQGINKFKRYCIEELKFDTHTNFNLLAAFMDNILNNEDFIQLQYLQMQRELEKQNIKIDRTTIKEYFMHLYKINWFAFGLTEYNYYIYDETIKESRAITQEEYKAAWQAYWQGTYNDTNEAIKGLYICSSGLPKKKPKVELNGIYNSQYEDVKEIIREMYNK